MNHGFLTRGQKVTAEQYAARSYFISNNPEEKWMNNYHPDQRSVPCDPACLLESEWSERTGTGYVAGDGAWYDPVNREFWGIETVEV
jgi:hypothetical protein